MARKDESTLFKADLSAQSDGQFEAAGGAQLIPFETDLLRRIIDCRMTELATLNR